MARPKKAPAKRGRKPAASKAADKAAIPAVIAKASAAALARGNEGMVFAPLEVQATLQLLGPAAHTEAAMAMRDSLSTRIVEG